MKFILNCQQAEELGKKLNDYSTKLSDTTSELQLLKVDGDFDWAGTINLINSNINITADRMKNAQKYIQLVVDKHTGLQKTFEYPTVVANDTVKKTTPVENPIPVPQDPTIKPSSSENQTDSTKATTINQKTSDTASSSETIVPPSSTTTSTSTTSPGLLMQVIIQHQMVLDTLPFQRVMEKDIHTWLGKQLLHHHQINID